MPGIACRGYGPSLPGILTPASSQCVILVAGARVSRIGVAGQYRAHRLRGSVPAMAVMVDDGGDQSCLEVEHVARDADRGHFR